MLPRKTSEAEHAQNLEAADKEGYVLTRYFYDALGRFEKIRRECATRMRTWSARLKSAKK